MLSIRTYFKADIWPIFSHSECAYDLIELPFGYGHTRLGLSILVKRSFAHTNDGIINTKHDKKKIKPKDVYQYENEFLEREVKSAKEKNK